MAQFEIVALADLKAAITTVFATYREAYTRIHELLLSAAYHPMPAAGESKGDHTPLSQIYMELGQSANSRIKDEGKNAFVKYVTDTLPFTWSKKDNRLSFSQAKFKEMGGDRDAIIRASFSRTGTFWTYHKDTQAVSSANEATVKKVDGQKKAVGFLKSMAQAAKDGQLSDEDLLLYKRMQGAMEEPVSAPKPTNLLDAVRALIKEAQARELDNQERQVLAGLIEVLQHVK